MNVFTNGESRFTVHDSLSIDWNRTTPPPGAAYWQDFYACHVNGDVYDRCSGWLSVDTDRGVHHHNISPSAFVVLTHWGWVTHICVGTNTNIDSDNGLSPGRRQAIIWTNAGILLIVPLATNFSEILIEILTFSFQKMRLKVSSVKWRPSCLGLIVLTHWGRDKMADILQPHFQMHFLH